MKMIKKFLADHGDLVTVVLHLFYMTIAMGIMTVVAFCIIDDNYNPPPPHHHSSVR